MRIRFVRSPSGSTPVIEPRIADARPEPMNLSASVGDIRVLETSRGRSRSAGGRVMVSLGPHERVTTETIRQAGGATARWLLNHGLSRAALIANAVRALPCDHALEALSEGLLLGAFRFLEHKSDKQRVDRWELEIVDARQRSAATSWAPRLIAIAQAVHLTRAWAHEPPNLLNPVTLARRTVSLARSSGLGCTVYDEKQLARMQARAILSVGMASRSKPRLIVLSHRGTPQGKRQKPVVLVGKAITFDTGGYSLKDREGIVGMKYDKCGGMAVIGAMQAVAALRVRTPVIGIVAAAENMISGEAYRPNDIIKTMNGKTVEIISTDAEGRLVLADALTFAQQRYRPRAIIDLATLTGGVTVALGAARAGLFANDDDLAGRLFESGERVHERLWRLPLDDDYFELIKGDDSDMKNSGGRAAHPILGGIFLKQFVDAAVPWAHLDIAGTATTDKDAPYCPKGATGFGVRLLIDYLQRL